jgi:hypothetical protein
MWRMEMFLKLVTRINTGKGYSPVQMNWTGRDVIVFFTFERTIIPFKKQ